MHDSESQTLLPNLVPPECCQPPNRQIPAPDGRIDVAYKFCSTSYNEYISYKAAPVSRRGYLVYNEYFASKASTISTLHLKYELKRF